MAERTLANSNDKWQCFNLGEVTTGVPQGLVLCPISFITLINWSGRKINSALMKFTFNAGRKGGFQILEGVNKKEETFREK